MAAGMAADDMAAPMQVANLGFTQESRCIDPIRRDKKIAAPAKLLEQVGSVEPCTDPSVVEGDQQADAARQPHFGGMSGRRVQHGGDSFEMALEVSAIQLVNIGIGTLESAQCELSRRNNVVVQQCESAHQALLSARAARFHRRYALSQGCPQAWDFRPEVSIGRAVPAMNSPNFSRSASRLSKTTRAWMTLGGSP